MKLVSMRDIGGGQLGVSSTIKVDPTNVIDFGLPSKMLRQRYLKIAHLDRNRRGQICRPGENATSSRMGFSRPGRRCRYRPSTTRTLVSFVVIPSHPTSPARSMLGSFPGPKCRRTSPCQGPLVANRSMSALLIPRGPFKRRNTVLNLSTCTLNVVFHSPGRDLELAGMILEADRRSRPGEVVKASAARSNGNHGFMGFLARMTARLSGG